tara:strand:+ start:209 stop:457 length:249 start_codon:yes stop_codon:yes gene_type:complete
MEEKYMLKVYFRKKNLYFLILVALIFLITNSFILTEARSALILAISNGLFATLLSQLRMNLWARNLGNRHKNCEISEFDYLD